jgi:hypothetical protein
MKYFVFLMTLVMLASVTLAPAKVRASDTPIDPAAASRLRASIDYIAGLQQFSLEAQTSIEVVLQSGQKLQFDNAVAATLQRPNRMLVERKGELLNQVFYYDGSKLTLHNPADGFYARVDAPGNLDDMLDFARNELDIVAPAGDFLYSDAFEAMMQDVKTAFVVGVAELDGVLCDHLAFSAPGTDWQIWVEQGDKPLPRKLVITSRDVLNAPQFSLVINNWNLNPTIPEGMFNFTPPDKAVEIEFMNMGGSGK